MKQNRMNSENKMNIHISGIADKFTFLNVNLLINSSIRKALPLWSIMIVLFSQPAISQCKLKETIIPGTDLKMTASDKIRLEGDKKNYSYNFIRIDTSYFVSSKNIKRAIDHKSFSINDTCPLVFLLESKQKVIIYPINPLSTDMRISNYLLSKQGSRKIYYTITPFQIEEITSSFYTSALLYFKSDKLPEKSATDIWGSYFSFETEKSQQIKLFTMVKCLVTQ